MTWWSIFPQKLVTVPNLMTQIKFLSFSFQTQTYLALTFIHPLTHWLSQGFIFIGSIFQILGKIYGFHCTDMKLFYQLIKVIYRKSLQFAVFLGKEKSANCEIRELWGMFGMKTIEMGEKFSKSPFSAIQVYFSGSKDTFLQVQSRCKPNFIIHLYSDWYIL